MKHFLFSLMALAFIGGARCEAQTAADVNEGARMTQNATTGQYTFSWWGRSGRTYFVQQSEDMVHWSYLPLIESGGAAVTEYGFTSSAPRFFLRLRHTNAATGGNPDTADFDGDGLTNLQELSQFHTDPYNVDSDGDGSSDSTEIANGTSPTDQLDFPSNQLPSSQTENGLVEPNFYLMVQHKYVINTWNSPPNTGTITWEDAAGHSGHLDNQPSVPQWSARMALLTYPPGVSMSETWRNLSPKAYASAYASGVSGGGVSLLRVRPALVGYENIAPWPVTRHYLKVGTTISTSPSGPPVNVNYGFVSATVPEGQKLSPTLPELSVDPITGKTVNLSYSKIDFSTSGSGPPSKGLDTQIYPPWLMIPAGGSSTVQVSCDASSTTPYFFKAVGGSITPPMSVATLSSSSLTFAGGANDSDDGKVTVGVETTFSDNDPVLRFSVKTRKTLKVTVHPIGLLSAAGVTTLPLYDSSYTSYLKSRLDEIFGLQANIYSEVTIKPTKVVAWDVGLESLPGGGTPKGAGDGVLDIFYHTSATQALYSNEEALIGQAEPADPAANVNVYYIGAPGISIGKYSWGLGIRTRLLSGQYQEYSTPLGFAGKRLPQNYNLVYVWDYIPDDAYDPERSRPSEHAWAIAHEIGHVLGLAHCCGLGADAPFERPNSDNETRLMTGRAGLKRFDNPRVLIKEEWDVIHNSPVLSNPP